VPTPPVVRRAALALILAAACWGVGTVISKRAVAEIQPLSLLAIQLSVSVLALGLVVGVGMVLRRGPRAPSGAGPGLGRLGLLGLLNPGAAYALSLIGLTQVSASLSVLLWAGEPLLILVLARRFLREPLTSRLMALSIAAALGMVLVLAGPGTGGQLGGILATLAGVACCAVYSVLARRMISDAPSTIRVVLAQQAWALAFAIALVAALAAVGFDLIPTGVRAGVPVSADAWLSAVGSGLVYYGLAYAF
jgi:drug/metabolite transporter (DMT)-like permease